MIAGVVNARPLATVRLPVRGPRGQDQVIEAIVDTGFTGALTLPPGVIASLGLPWRTRGSAVLANGSIDQFDIHAGTVIWDGVPRSILVEAADTNPLVGMRLIHGHDLRIRAIQGGAVEIEPLS